MCCNRHPCVTATWQLESPLRLDGVVTLVDAANYETEAATLEFVKQARRQAPNRHV